MNSAILKLLRFHFTSRLRRFRKAFSTKRRLALSIVTVLLSLAWLGQSVFSVLLRDPYDPAKFRSWVAFGLMAYFCWHIVRVAWQRPDEAIEWSAEEQALIVDGPFQRIEILTYRVYVIFTSTLPKALLTSFVLWPDLGPFGCVGILLALIFLEFFRMVADLGSSCLPERSYTIFRSVVVSIVVCAALAAWPQFDLQNLTSSSIVNGINSIRSMHVMQTIESPFQFAASAIAGHESAGRVTIRLLVLLLATVALGVLVVWLDKKYQSVVLSNEQAQVYRIQSDIESSESTKTLPKIPLTGPIGVLAWRQSKRANRYFGSLVISMGIPAVLSWLPLYSMQSRLMAFNAVVCLVLFYTFVLLPEAIKFDFRLDSDHLYKLKMLPMTSTKIVLGQLATPIGLACIFQAAVILFAAIVRSVPVHMVIGALGITIPLTIVFVATDNLIFLLYPHRPTQEGFEAFLRTILKFTGKSLLLMAGGGVLVLWAPAAAMISKSSAALTAPIVFVAGVCVGISILAVAMLLLVVKAYDRFDISLDSVG